MQAEKPLKVQFEFDRTTGQVKKALLDRDNTGVFEEIELDSDALIDLLKGGERAKDILAERTGPDPRRLPR